MRQVWRDDIVCEATISAEQVFVFDTLLVFIAAFVFFSAHRGASA
jgi:hypothetical protein